MLFITLALSIIVPLGMFFISERKSCDFKRSLAFNVISFFGVLLLTTVFMFSHNTLAESTSEITQGMGLGYLASALVTGLSTIGAGIATGSAASAALGAISENESIMGKALIFVALAEGIAIYGLLISFTILGRI